MNDPLRRGVPTLLALSCCLPLLLGACSKSNDTATTTTAPSTAAPAVNAGPTIAATEFAFDPDPAPVKVGQVVTWRNDGSAKHQVSDEADSSTPAPAPFESPLIAPGETYQFTFNTPGTYNYICRIHPEKMKGSLTVTA